MPERLIDAISQTRLVEPGSIAFKPIARKLQARRIWARGPFLNRNGHLDDALTVEHAVRASLVKLVERRVYLAAHRIGRNAQQAAHTRTPRSPCAGIERGRTVQGNVRAAGKPFRRRDANANARKRAGATSNQIGIDFATRAPCIGQGGVNRVHKLDVRPATTHMVARRKNIDRHPLVASGIRYARNRARKHVRRCIDCHHEAFTRHLLHSFVPFWLKMSILGALSLSKTRMCARYRFTPSKFQSFSCSGPDYYH